MKKILLLSIFTALLSPCFAQIPPYMPTSGLLAWYPFSGNMNDLSGNGNHATGSSVSLTTDRYGTAGSAYLFSAASSSVIVSPVIAHTLQDYALCAWVRASTIGTASGGTTPSGMGNTIITSDLTGYGGYGMGVTSDFLRSIQDTYWFMTPHTTDTGIWYCFIGNFSAATGKTYLYIDGNFIDSFAFPPYTASADYTNFRIGNGLAEAWNLPFDGKIDDVAIYDRTLTECEIFHISHSTASFGTGGTITGASSVCAGNNITLSNTTSGGVWSSASTGIATVNSSGVVTGVSSGVATISYTVTDGCSTVAATKNVTVNASPSAITGSTTLCAGTTTALGNAVTGGTWSSSATAIATIHVSSGVLAGISAGTANITYTVGGSCRTTTQITVNPGFTGTISGATNVCVGSTTTFSHATSGGTWSSSNTALATVSSSTGVITGVSAGTATITYNVTGCIKTKSITVNAGTGASITGATTICVGNTSVLSYSASGTSWTSSNTAVATIGITSGVVTGISVGTSQISFLGTSGCGSSTVVTVLPSPTAISGTLAFCQGTTSTLASIGTTGGTWASSAPSRASVGVATGIVTGVRGGTANITYTWTNSCKRTAQVTVNPIPPAAAIVGAGTMSPTTAPTQMLAASTPGGTWASGNPAVATIVAGTGFMTAISAGTVVISYTQTNACGTTINVRIFTVLSPRPGAQLAGAEGSVVFSVYPNPTSGAVTVETNTNGIFTVYTIDGRQVAQYTIREAISPLTLPGGLASGLYMCRFNGDDGSTVMVRLVYER